jgi:hypothetical protein
MRTTDEPWREKLTPEQYHVTRGRKRMYMGSESEETTRRYHKPAILPWRAGPGIRMAPLSGLEELRSAVASWTQPG